MVFLNACSIAISIVFPIQLIGNLSDAVERGELTRAILILIFFEIEFVPLLKIDKHQTLD